MDKKKLDEQKIQKLQKSLKHSIENCHISKTIEF